ncbi:MAG: class I SAM-dependent methyltransferase [Acidimicrobiia bacterium]|nr:class I SAM-dependent methyltransferase [Acidimicrobiia bacterium]
MSPAESSAGSDGHWFEDIARFLGPAYLRYSFTKGTTAEVAFLIGALALTPGDRVLDAGCGPGRHALEMSRRGIDVLGLDISTEFVELAREAAAEESLRATFEVEDLRHFDRPGSFDAVLCLCQGGFGLLGGPGDEAVFGRLARALAPGGRMALTAFSLAFMIRHLEEGETLGVSESVLHETTVLKDVDGLERPAELWTTGFTARELRLLSEGAGLVVDGVYGVTPGRYGNEPPTLDDPELLLLAHRS